MEPKERAIRVFPHHVFTRALCQSLHLLYIQSHFYLACISLPTMDVNVLFPEINSFVLNQKKIYPAATKKSSRSRRRRHNKKEKLRALKRRADEEAKQPSDTPPQPSENFSVGQDADEDVVMKRPSDAPQLEKVVSDFTTRDGEYYDSGRFLEVNLPEKKRKRLVSLSDQMEGCSYHLRSRRNY